MPRCDISSYVSGGPDNLLSGFARSHSARTGGRLSLAQNAGDLPCLRFASAAGQQVVRPTL